MYFCTDKDNKLSSSNIIAQVTILHKVSLLSMEYASRYTTSVCVCERKKVRDTERKTEKEGETEKEAVRDREKERERLALLV